MLFTATPKGYLNVSIRRGGIDENNTMKRTQTIVSLLDQCLNWEKCFRSFRDGSEIV